MNGLIENPAFQTYAVCSAILAIKMLLTGNYTSAQRMRTKGFVNEEDAKAFRGQANAQEHPAVAHALRIQRNDLENIPLFFVIGLIYVLDGASASAATCETHCSLSRSGPMISGRATLRLIHEARSRAA